MGAATTGLEMIGVDLIGAEMTGAETTGLEMIGVDLMGVEMTGAVWILADKGLPTIGEESDESDGAALTPAKMMDNAINAWKYLFFFEQLLF